MHEPNDGITASRRGHPSDEWIQQRTETGKNVIAQYDLGSTLVESIVLARWSRLEGVMQSEDLPLLHDMCKSVVNRDPQWWPDDDEAVPDDDIVTAVSAEEWKIVHSAERFLKVHSELADQSFLIDRTSKIADQAADVIEMMNTGFTRLKTILADKEKEFTDMLEMKDQRLFLYMGAYRQLEDEVARKRALNWVQGEQLNNMAKRLEELEARILSSAANTLTDFSDTMRAVESSEKLRSCDSAYTPIGSKRRKRAISE